MAIAVDATNASTAIASFNIGTLSHTIGAANEVLVVSIAARVAQPSTNNNVSTVTYNGVGLTPQAGTVNNAISPDTFSGKTEIWTLVNPATGVHNIVVTWGGNVTYGGFGASSWTGVDQSTPVEATGGSVGAGTALQGTITTVSANAQLIDAVYSRSSALTKNAAQTQIGTISLGGGDDTIGASYKNAGASGAKTMDWTEANDGNDWAMSIIALKASTVTATSNRQGLVNLMGVGN